MAGKSNPLRRRRWLIRVHPWLQFFRTLEPAFRDLREQGFRVVPVELEDLPHQIADALIAAFVEDENRWTRAAECASEQTGRPQLQNLRQTRHQRRSIRLVESIFQRCRKRRGSAR